jgi:DNA polymerase
MFVEPTLRLNLPMLESHLETVKERKAKLLAVAQADKDSLMSTDKFAELLKLLAVEPPTKISARTGKQAWAFAKTDEEFKALLEHPDPRVQALVSARLGNKTTLEETRTQRFIEIALRGSLPVPIKYYAAHTGRWGGDDKINLQNLPSRGHNANKLKLSIEAPEGYVIIDSDSSQIEARVLAWLAGQTDVLKLFAAKQDVYRHMAGRIFGINPSDVTDEQRFIGKTTVLGAGYGMGPVKFQAQLANMGKQVDIDTCKMIIKRYRLVNPNISSWWEHLSLVLDCMCHQKPFLVDYFDVMTLDPLTGIRLPNGLNLSYPELRRHSNGEFTYMTRTGVNKIYGGKVAENLCQAVARCIIGEQMIQISKRYRVVLTVHDAIASVVPEADAAEARAYIEECMRTPPVWAAGLPLNCESGMARNYGDC